MSVAGLDGLDIGACSHPPLTSVVQPARTMGIRAAEYLIARLDGMPSPPSNQLLSYSIRNGKSVSTPPNPPYPFTPCPRPQTAST
jgi:DNA-binding LacI/PurR family transcriptional regulator